LFETITIIKREFLLLLIQQKSGNSLFYLVPMEFNVVAISILLFRLGLKNYE